jgi:phosphatidylinositol 4-kinase
MELLPGQTTSIKNLTYDQVLYILSIYHMETLRAKSGTFQAVFAYLEDPGIANNEYLSDCCKAIADKAFPGFLEFLKSHPSKEKREVILEAETQVLMIKYCSRSLGARKVADKSIVSIAEAYPQITWNRACLQTLLDLVETIGKACDDLLRVCIQCFL